MSGPAMVRWSGVVARLNESTVDGRLLLPTPEDRAFSRLPVPLLLMARLTPETFGMRIGSVASVSVQDDELRASGWVWLGGLPGWLVDAFRDPGVDVGIDLSDYRALGVDGQGRWALAGWELGSITIDSDQRPCWEKPCLIKIEEGSR